MGWKKYKTSQPKTNTLTFDEVLNSDISNIDFRNQLSADDKERYVQYLNTVADELDANRQMDEDLKIRVRRVILNYCSGLVYLNSMLDFIVKQWVGIRGDALNLLLDFFDVAVNKVWRFGIQLSVLEEWERRVWWTAYCEFVRLNDGSWYKNTMRIRKTPHEATVRKLGGFSEDDWDENDDDYPIGF